MISYLPFTYISQPYLSAIRSQLGSLIVYTPDSQLVPDHMRSAADQGAIELRSLQGAEPGHLLPALEAYRQWAELHEGHLTDMAGFVKATKERFPLMDETNPTQISSQIRKFGQSAVDENDNPLFQAALFLAVAQDYDQQQDVMRQQMGAVNSMEQEMLAGLSGPTDTASGEDGMIKTSAATADLEPGGYMTVARIEAWAHLALQDADPPLVYLTTSRAVMDHMLDLFSGTEKIVRLALLGAGSESDPAMEKRRATLLGLTDASKPSSDELIGMETADDDATAGLDLFRLTGISPLAMLQRLCPSSSAAAEFADEKNAQSNALIGLISLS